MERLKGKEGLNVNNIENPLAKFEKQKTIQSGSL